MVMLFPAKKNAGRSKAPCDFPPRKDDILLPPSVCLGAPPPPPEAVRTDGRTLTSESKFVAIGCQISLPMVLRSAAFAPKELRYHERHDTNEFLAKQTTVAEKLQDSDIPPNQFIQITWPQKLTVSRQL